MESMFSRALHFVVLWMSEPAPQLREKKDRNDMERTTNRRTERMGVLKHVPMEMVRLNCGKSYIWEFASLKILEHAIKTTQVTES